ncbi:MAG: GatB/YqeY domain-containing protein [Deltaproteobacteria bacterium]|nr:GatB/YqeY domain-containing protein [Deltaproteobacteria bacterium]
MKLVEKISEDLKEAMKAKDDFRVSCLRMLKTSLKLKQVEKGQALEDEAAHSVVASLIRKGQDAAAEFRKGNREDLAAKEEREVNFLYTYMPRQMTPAEIEAVLREVMRELSAQGLKDLGKVMKTAMARLGDQAQGKQVNEIARRLVS